jgi:DNA repair exonuclease SbcCD ATPase subunit
MAVVQALTDTAALAAAVQRHRRVLDRQAGQAQQVAKAGRAADAEIAELTAKVELYAKVAALLTAIGEEAQESARRQFEQLASQALQAVFGAGLSFRLVPGEAGGQATLEPVIRSEHAGGAVIETPVMDSRGGGMAAVTGFVLQLVMIMLTPGAAPIIFLDETFAHVPVANRATLAGFLRTVAAEAGVQVVMVTHDPEYAGYADVVVRFEPGPDGTTRVHVEES